MTSLPPKSINLPRMKRQRPGRPWFTWIITGIILIALAVYGIWAIGISETLIESKINSALGPAKENIKISGLKKGPFFDLKADEIRIASKGKEVVTLKSFHAKPRFLSIPGMKPTMDFTARAAGGDISGAVVYSGGKADAEIAFSGLRIEEFPQLKAAGITATGILGGNAKINGATGEAKFLIENIIIEDVRIRESRFTMDMIEPDILRNIRAAVDFGFGNAFTADVKSLSADGDGFYARATGSLAGGMLDMKIEFMPKPEFTEKYPAVSLLKQYEKSPGAYEIPVRKRLSAR